MTSGVFIVNFAVSVVDFEQVNTGWVITFVHFF